MTEVTRMRWLVFQNIPKIFSKVLFKTLNSNMSYVPEPCRKRKVHQPCRLHLWYNLGQTAESDCLYSAADCVSENRCR